MNDRIIPLYKKQIYNVPNGAHPSIVVAMYHLKSNKDCDTPVKILFAPINMGKKLQQSVVASEYCTDFPNAQLTDDLETILGGQLEQHLDDNGDFDHRIVEGRLVDIVVESFQGEDHKQPYTFVTGVFPPGTLSGN